MTQTGLFVLGATLALAGVVLGQVDSTAAQTARSQTESTASAPTRSQAPQRTANDLLKALRRSKPIRELVSPAGPLNSNATSRPKPLLPEGTTVVDWEGTLTKDGIWWVITPESPASEPPTKVLPNINLEVITRSLAGKSSPVRFSVSGEMTAFQGENFLLIRFVRRLAVAAAAPPPVPSKAETGAEAQDPDGKELPPPSAEDVIDMLHDQKPRSVVSASRARRGAGRIADFSSPSVRPDGSAFAQRPGRLMRDDKWWRFSFETEHSGAEEPTIKLLPGRGLELMIQSAEETRDGLVLLVSGELTQFRGQNYLLPRGVVRRTGMDNLRK